MRNFLMSLLLVATGVFACHAAQKLVLTRFQNCMNKGIRSVQSQDEFDALQALCSPSKLTLTVLFW